MHTGQLTAPGVDLYKGTVQCFVLFTFSTSFFCFDMNWSRPDMRNWQKGLCIHKHGAENMQCLYLINYGTLWEGILLAWSSWCFIYISNVHCRSSFESVRFWSCIWAVDGNVGEKHQKWQLQSQFGGIKPVSHIFCLNHYTQMN